MLSCTCCLYFADKISCVRLSTEDAIVSQKSLSQLCSKHLLCALKILNRCPIGFLSDNLNCKTGPMWSSFRCACLISSTGNGSNTCSDVWVSSREIMAAQERLECGASTDWMVASTQSDGNSSVHAFIIVSMFRSIVDRLSASTFSLPGLYLMLK